MPYEEKRAWIMGVVSAVAYAIYVAVVLGRARDSWLTDVPYAWLMVTTIGAAIVSTIVVSIVAGILSPRTRSTVDERDREIGRLGDRIGQSFVVLGGVAGMLLALIEADYFWIANIIYLGFFLSATVGSAARIIAYHKAFQTW
ncbi:MAG: hypothetical protein HOU81_07365 [Hamadaea sp.]|uniref:hypothetical protein n=1 Tax=Hamadaea sp. TaxID=2024425 RepID=UPI0017C3EF0F|nr:hypothetical protein [Hamadaea sp.]NUR70623.1 hypothetical protein [Hamadaea sp.]NUT22361.1 hypothetical protein [Hamadaea sp.]